MIDEATTRGLKVIFILATREQDWELFLDNPTKRKYHKFDYLLKLEDKLESNHSKILVNTLIDNNVIKITPERNRKDYIRVFQGSRNLMVSLMETIENTTFGKAISSEYDRLSESGRNAYGIISLLSRYGLPFKMELLQRTLEILFKTNWSEFIAKVVQAEGKDVIREEGSGAFIYYVCRHSVIAEKITLMHFKGVEENEIHAIKAIIRSVNKGTREEVLVGKFLLMLTKASQYSFDDIIDLLNTAIYHFNDSAFLLHVKGQLYLDFDQPEEALPCFEKNIEDDTWNKMYSLHSAGMAHFSLGRACPLTSGQRQLEFQKAKEYLWQGMQRYKDNPFFYRSLLQLLNQKATDGFTSESIKRDTRLIIENAEQNLYDELDDIQELKNLVSQIESFFND